MKSVKRFCAILLLTCVPLVAPQLSRAGDSAPHAGRPKVVGYFPQWGVYGGYYVKNVVTSGSATRLTHLNYAFANVVNNACVSYDPLADYQLPLTADQTVDGEADSTAPGAFAGNFHQLQELKKRYPNLQVVISLGGGGADPNAFSSAALPANRQGFVKSCVDMFIRGNFAPGIQEPGIFDGIDVDWEFPATDADKTNFTALLKEFREQLDAARPNMTLSIAAPAGGWAYQFIELKKIQHSVTFLNLMNYDFDGPWNNATGLVAPLYQTWNDPDPSNNANAAVKAYLQMGVKSAKIVFGVPFYGYEWTDVPNVNHGLFQPGVPVGYGSGYSAIVPVEGQFSKYRDPITQAPWLYDGKNFWTYDDPVSLKFKMEYVRHQRLAGVMFWELSGDLPDGRLVKALAKGLQRKGDE